MHEKKTILIVDDVPENISLLLELLKGGYKTKIANNGERALKVVKQGGQPDLILLDIMMPVMDGHEVCRRLKADETTRNIPVIFLTAKSQPEDEKEGLRLGAVDYVTKPISPAILLQRIQNHLELKDARDYLENRSHILEEMVQKRTMQLNQVQDVTMVAMGALAESRDPDTGNHIRRTQTYVKLLANYLSTNPRFSKELTAENIELLFKSAPLHDIGKVGVPDSILLKPGRLTADEFKEMQKHTVYGYQAIAAAETSISDAETFLHYAKEIALYHHARWDGNGYPEPIGGDDIPLSARLMAIADVYDAMICRRCYKEPIPHEEVVQEIIDSSGKQFDPDIVDAFVKLQDQFHAVSERLKDN